MSIATIPVALSALAAGRAVLVADDEGRENEGDVIFSAALATRETLAWTIRHSSGYICAPLTGELADRLKLPMMVEHSEDVRSTAYTITVDAARGISTGISASDRALTLRTLGSPEAVASDLIRPGHIVPLRAVDGGVLERAGHTEAAVDLMRLAGLPPVGAICEIVNDDGEMTRLPGLLALGAEFDMPVITIADLIAYRRALAAEGADLAAGPGGAPAAGAAPTPAASPAAGASAVYPPAVSFEVETLLPTTHGAFRVRAYRDRATGADHLAFIADRPAAADGLPPILRVHSECITGEAFGSLKCECGPQLRAALDRIDSDGGIVIYLRGQEGRGIGLINKLRAYSLQETGMDTLDANLALGLPADARSYAAASAILDDLGVPAVRLLTNNPEKIRQLGEQGISIAEALPLVVGVGEVNEAYLQTKRDRMGHRFAGSAGEFIPFTPTETTDTAAPAAPITEETR